jgi:DNA-directed RNA polymerase subunit K
MAKQEIKEYTKYEEARILGARALQIAMDAPLLKKIAMEDIEKVDYNPFDIAKEEFRDGILPITVKQPMPKKKSVKIIKAVEKEDKNANEAEEEIEEKEIAGEGEIMELANPEDEEIPAEENDGRESSEELQ